MIRKKEFTEPEQSVPTKQNNNQSAARTTRARIRYLALVSWVVLWAASTTSAQSVGTFTPTGVMIAPRANHSATLLIDGKVLITGGAGATAELYDPSTGIFTSAGSMTEPRLRNSATLLADGRVLIAGGGSERAASAELYDPSTRTFIATGDMLVSDLGLATLLADGRVLIAHNSAAGVYDPATGAFSLAGPYAQPPYCCVALGTITLLADGRVLLTGCTSPCRNGANQTYDPRSNTFSATGDMRYYDLVNTATLMMDGRVLLAGNSEIDGFRAEAETYDPSAGTFRNIGNTIGSHAVSAATLLPDRSVLITGGAIPGGSGNSDSELFVPATGEFSLTAKLTTPRSAHSSTLLPDGTVLIAGGYSVWPNATASAEIYRPRSTHVAAVLLSLSGDGGRQGAIQHASTYQVVSPEDPAKTREILAIYWTGLIDESVIPPQIAIAGKMAEVLWFGSVAGYPGLNQINVRVPDGIAPGTAVPVRMNYVGRPSNEVTICITGLN